MTYLKINGTDVSYLVKGLKVGYETLVADNSGRNARGDTVLEIVNKKVKLYVSFRPMDGADMKKLLATFEAYANIPITYYDSKTNTTKTIKCYTGTPEPEYYWIKDTEVLYKPMDLNFIQM
jgi:hypothetical protein